MTIGYTGAWTSKAGLLIKATGSSAKPVSQSFKVKQMLALVGNDPNALDIAKMDKLKVHTQIKGFNPENVSARSLGNLTAFLKAQGLIGDVTAVTLSNAGDTFDRFGVPSDSEAPFNALEYFATQLDTIQNNNLKGNKYANYLIPEYKKAIYVLQNLANYGKGNGTSVPTDQNLSARA